MAGLAFCKSTTVFRILARFLCPIVSVKHFVCSSYLARANLFPQHEWCLISQPALSQTVLGGMSGSLPIQSMIFFNIETVHPIHRQIFTVTLRCLLRVSSENQGRFNYECGVSPTAQKSCLFSKLSPPFTYL